VTTEKGIVAEVTEAITDNKHSIDEKAPGLPFALVTFSYMAILVIAGLMVAAFLWFRT